MLREDVAREIIVRTERGEGVKRIARELGVNRKTVQRWRRLGGWRPQHRRRWRLGIEAFAEFARNRAPEVGCNGAVLYRELRSPGFGGG